MKKKRPRNPLTDEDVAAFDRAIQKWRATLNLSDWEVYRGEGEIRAKDIRAELYDIEPEHRLAKYRVSRDFGPDAVTGDSIEGYARHEMLHLFIYELIVAAAEHGADSKEVMTQEHRIIKVLGPLLDPWLDSQVEDADEDVPQTTRH